MSIEKNYFVYISPNGGVMSQRAEAKWGRQTVSRRAQFRDGAVFVTFLIQCCLTHQKLQKNELNDFNCLTIFEKCANIALTLL